MTCYIFLLRKGGSGVSRDDAMWDMVLCTGISLTTCSRSHTLPYIVLVYHLRQEFIVVVFVGVLDHHLVYSILRRSGGSVSKDDAMSKIALYGGISLTHTS